MLRASDGLQPIGRHVFGVQVLKLLQKIPADDSSCRHLWDAEVMLRGGFLFHTSVSRRLFIIPLAHSFILPPAAKFLLCTVSSSH